MHEFEKKKKRVCFWPLTKHKDRSRKNGTSGGFHSLAYAATVMKNFAATAKGNF